MIQVQGLRHSFQSGGGGGGGAETLLSKWGGGLIFFWYKSHGLGVGGGCATFQT